MKVNKALQEVWDWKEKVYQKTKDLSKEEAIAEIRQGAEDFCKRYHLKLTSLQPAQK